MNPADFGQLYSTYKSRYIVVALGYVRDRAVAEDIVNDSFLAFWENRHRIPDGSNIPGYIMTTLKNKCLNWLKQQKVHAEIDQKIHSIQQRVMQANIRSLELCNPTHVFENEVEAIVNKELETMPESTRRIFIANRYHDKSYKEIALEYNITPRRVDHELQKALRILRKALRDYLPPPPGYSSHY
ncbi:MAG: RNA polymerase sigma-70 factor [Alistipes sp.]|nr:RNA polymerase sigma-70 factor [Alistipes sp.]